MQAKQRSIFNGFAFDLVENGETIGAINWPNVAQAKNARLQFHKDFVDGSIAVALEGRDHLITFEHLRRGWTNDIRYEIVAKSHPAHALAQVDVTHPPGWRSRPFVTQNLPHPLHMASKRTLLRIQHTLALPDGTPVGTLKEPSRLSLARHLVVTLKPGYTLPLTAQALLLFLAINNA